MTDILEVVAVAVIHTTENVNCPFCPDEEPEPFTTYPGDANNSGVLGDVMQDPNLLVSKQSGCRPKERAPKRQSPSDAKPKPNPIYHCDFGGVPHIYTCEAHHAISGKQAMKNHKVEQWIWVDGKKDFEIEKDTGYSINNADNGVWLPSVPVHLSTGQWGGLARSRKQQIAYQVMDANKGQWHKGPHNISDKEDKLEGKLKDKYDTHLKGQLTKINDRIVSWSEKCKFCKEKDDGKLWPNHKVHDMLDSLSKIIIEELEGPVAGWETFISRLALDFFAEKTGSSSTGSI